MSFMAPPVPPILPQRPMTKPAPPVRPMLPPTGFPPPPPMDPMQMGRPGMPPVVGGAGAPLILPTGGGAAMPLPGMPRPVGPTPTTAPPVGTPPGWPGPTAPVATQPFAHPPAPEVNYAARKARKRATGGGMGEPMQATTPVAGNVRAQPEGRRRLLEGGSDRAAVQRKAMRMKGEYS